MTSTDSVVDISANGVLCLQSRSHFSFVQTSINSCNYKDGDFIEVSVQSADTSSELGFIAHFTLTDELGVNYNVATGSDWFCNYYPSVIVDSKFPSYKLNGLTPNSSWIWDISNARRVVCYYQFSYFYYVTAKVSIDNYFDAFEIRDSNGISKYRWDVTTRDDGSFWNTCRFLNVSVKIEIGDTIYIEGGADSDFDSLSYGGTGLNVYITIRSGPKTYNISTSAGSSWLCADNYNQSRWGANNNLGVGTWQNSVSSNMPNHCSTSANSIWNWYTVLVVCKFHVTTLLVDPYDEFYP